MDTRPPTPGFNQRVLKNILVGSSMRLVVHIVRHRGMIYPKRVFLFMEPTSFNTVVSRDRWFRSYHKHWTTNGDGC